MVSIVTPNFRSGERLHLCIASVADQEGDIEHIIQDAGSDDGTLDWLLKENFVRIFVEKDAGMYDALNRGFARAKGDVFGWLNADEQYLPGTIQKVTAWFERNPGIDVLFGDVVYVDTNGKYLGHRKMQVPLLYHTWTCHLSTLSCATFFRKSLISERGFHLDSTWRCSGDAEWMLRLMRARIKMGTLNEFASVFTQTASNLGAGSIAIGEARRLRSTAPLWTRCSRPFVVAHHRLRRLLGGMYRQEPFAYEIFTLQSRKYRKKFQIQHPFCCMVKPRFSVACST